MEKKKMKSAVTKTNFGTALCLLGWLLRYIAPIGAACYGFVYHIDSTGARVSYAVFFVLALLLLAYRGMMSRKADGLRDDLSNYKSEANLSEGERKLKALHFYKQSNLALNVYDNSMLVGLVGLFYLVCMFAEKGFAKFADIFGICFICMFAGAVLSVIGSNLIREEE